MQYHHREKSERTRLEREDGLASAPLVRMSDLRVWDQGPEDPVHTTGEEPQVNGGATSCAVEDGVGEPSRKTGMRS